MGYIYEAIDNVELVEEGVDPIKPPILRQQKKVKKECSCCKWCLVILLVLVLLFVSVTLVVVGRVYFWTKHHVKRITVTDRMELPVHRLPDAELELIKERAKLFVDEIQAGRIPEQDFAITADEINGFIAKSDYLRGNAYVTISGDNKITTDLSLPANFLPGGKGRYFVGTGFLGIVDEDETSGTAVWTTKIETLHPIKDVDSPFLFGEFLVYWLSSSGGDTHELVVNIKNGKFMNWIVPQDYIDKKENLAQDIYEDKDPDDQTAVAILNGIQSVSVEHGAIIVHARRGGLAEESKSYPDSSSEKGFIGGGNLRKLLSGLLF